MEISRFEVVCFSFEFVPKLTAWRLKSSSSQKQNFVRKIRQKMRLNLIDVIVDLIRSAVSLD